MSSPDRPPSTSLVVLTALIPLVLLCGWSGMLSTLGHFDRPARPIAGPAERVTVPLRSGVVYRIYWKPSSDARSQSCRVDPSVTDDVFSYRMGSWGGLSEAVSDNPSGAEFDGERYRFADQVQLDLKDREVLDTTVSCADGPVLVEAATRTVRVASIIELVAYVVVPVAVVAVGWWLWWRRRRRVGVISFD